MEKLRKQFPSPFHDIMGKLYIPSRRVVEKKKEMMKRFKGEKYLAVHARGFYDNDGNSTKVTLTPNLTAD